MVDNTKDYEIRLTLKLMERMINSVRVFVDIEKKAYYALKNTNLCRFYKKGSLQEFLAHDSQLINY